MVVSCHPYSLSPFPKNREKTVVNQPSTQNSQSLPPPIVAAKTLFRKDTIRGFCVVLGAIAKLNLVRVDQGSGVADNGHFVFRE
jgi:hypothetical protein